jgi:hypothetical protein
MTALRENTAHAVPDVLLERLPRLIDFTIRAQDVQSIEFLRELLEWSSRSNEWRKVREVIVAGRAQFCRFLVADDKFTRFTQAALRFVWPLIRGSRRFGEIEAKVVVHISDLFFQYPQNSFLHNEFCTILEGLAAASWLTPQLICQMDLFNKIVAAYQRREKDVVSCFWGQLAIIADIIDRQARPVGVDAAVWRRDVRRVNAKRMKIMRRPWPSDVKWLIGMLVMVVCFILFAAWWRYAYS